MAKHLVMDPSGHSTVEFDPSNTVDITRLQPGLLMGKIGTVVNSLGTAGYYAPSIFGVTSGVKAAGDTTLNTGYADTDHSWDDHRIALQTLILDWLAKLPGVQRP